MHKETREMRLEQRGLHRAHRADVLEDDVLRLGLHAYGEYQRPQNFWKVGDGREVKLQRRRRHHHAGVLRLQQRPGRSKQQPVVVVEPLGGHAIGRGRRGVLRGLRPFGARLGALLGSLLFGFLLDDGRGLLRAGNVGIAPAALASVRVVAVVVVAVVVAVGGGVEPLRSRERVRAGLLERSPVARQDELQRGRVGVVVVVQAGRERAIVRVGPGELRARVSQQ
mmetsp:Transcript_3997/g.17682  ORF Transcript_3997/g.17682 Transcript_3997/m.17682 type:complete len:224 (-) Transcript_3997:735-1406(-)